MMNKTIISAFMIFSSLMVFGQSSPYKMIKTQDTEVTASNLKYPYYIDNVHPAEKLFKKGWKYAHKSVSYYGNGNIKEVWYQYRPNKKYTMFTYCHKEYYSNGQLKYDYYQNPFTEYNEGYENRFYENGQLQSTNWKTGFYYNGDRYTFCENGQLESYGYYAGFEGKGMEEGIWKYYHENGQLKAIGSYKNYFREQKTKSDRIHAPLSTKQGEWKYYNEYGELIKAENF